MRGNALWKLQTAGVLQLAFGLRVSDFALILMRLPQCPRKGIDQMIYQRDVASFGAFDATRKLRHVNHRCSRLLRNGFSGPTIQIWIHDDYMHLILFHFCNRLGQVSWRRRNPWFRLQEQIDLQAKAIAEIKPGVVIGDDLLALKWGQYPLPFG